ncbi:MAG: hypothetical protein Q7K57_15920 [Burkholderiaceae bacterium]|nr:hypothetical protein [Burkholderiaceae bacterium]
MEKLDAKEQAAAAVREHEDYVQRLASIHRTCSPVTDWQARATSRPPRKPSFSAENENKARMQLELYKPSLLSRLFGQVEMQKGKLAELIAKGKISDERSFSERSNKYQQDLADHLDETAFAERILRKEPEAMLEAVKLFEPLSSIGLLGEHLGIKLPVPNVMDVELSVHGEEVVPKDRAKLLASGRASVKPMPKGEYYRLYQDHVCSAGLRVARELLALLPVDEVIVTAVDDLVDPATGHLKQTAILSFRAPRATMVQLNFEAIDPSDSMRNFLHRMDFSTTTGFRPVESITTST